VQASTYHMICELLRTNENAREDRGRVVGIARE
jgi:hypothetical protein